MVTFFGCLREVLVVISKVVSNSDLPEFVELVTTMVLAFDLSYFGWAAMDT